MQSEYIVYTDSGVYFYPGWEKAHLNIFSKFDSVGMVTGEPVREKVHFHTTSTFRQIETEKGIEITKGKLITQSYLKDFRALLGDDAEIYISGEYRYIDDVMIEKESQQAYVGAIHFEFMLRTKVAQSLIPFPTNILLSGNESLLDESIDEIGLKRLRTQKRIVHHIGNSLEGNEWFTDFAGKNSIVKKSEYYKRSYLRKSLFKALARKFLLYTYSLIVRKLS